MMKIFLISILLAYLSVGQATWEPYRNRDGYINVQSWPEPTSNQENEPTIDFINLDEIGYESVNPIAGPDPTKLEVWTRTGVPNNMFVRVNGKVWIEFLNGKIETSFFEFGRNSAQVNLRNDRSNAGPRSFVALTASNALQGPSSGGLRPYATGTFNNWNIRIKPLTNPQKRPEGWVQAMTWNTIFLHFADKVWIEFRDSKPFASFKEFTRNVGTRTIGLKNDIQIPNAKHNFVALNSNNAFEGPFSNQTIRYLNGGFINFGNAETASLKDRTNPLNDVTVINLLDF